MVLFARARLMHAVKAGDTARIAELIAEGVDINAPHGKTKLHGRKTPLHVAATAGREAVVIFLLKNGAKPDPKDGYDWTPLHHAAHNGHLDIVVELLKAGADPNLRTTEGRTAYGWASLRQMPEVAKAIAPYMKRTAGEDVPGKTRPEPGWSLLSESQVAHVETHGSLGYRLTDIFNFRNRERVRIVHNLETKADQASSLCFDEIADGTQVEAARAELLRRGGRAEPDAGSLQKPHRPALPSPETGPTGG